MFGVFVYEMAYSITRRGNLRRIPLDFSNRKLFREWSTPLPERKKREDSRMRQRGLDRF
jgi:hypothetical protein